MSDSALAEFVSGSKLGKRALRCQALRGHLAVAESAKARSDHETSCAATVSAATRMSRASLTDVARSS